MKTITNCPLCGGEMTRRYYGVSCNECEFKCSEQDTALVAAGMQARSDVAKLKIALKDCLSEIKYINLGSAHLDSVGLNRAISNAEKCLGEKDA